MAAEVAFLATLSGDLAPVLERLGLSPSVASTVALVLITVVLSAVASAIILLVIIALPAIRKKREEAFVEED